MSQFESHNPSIDVVVINKELAVKGLPEELSQLTEERLNLLRQHILLEAQRMWPDFVQMLSLFELTPPDFFQIELEIANEMTAELQSSTQHIASWKQEARNMIAYPLYRGEEGIRSENRSPSPAELVGLKIKLFMTPLYGPVEKDNDVWVPKLNAELHSPLTIPTRLPFYLAGIRHELVHCFERYLSLLLGHKYQQELAEVAATFPFDTFQPTFLQEGTALLMQTNYLPTPEGKIMLSPLSYLLPRLRGMQNLDRDFFTQALYNQYYSPLPEFDPVKNPAGFLQAQIAYLCLTLSLVSYCNDFNDLDWLSPNLPGSVFDELDIIQDPSLMDSTILANLLGGEGVVWKLIAGVWSYYFSPANITQFVEKIKEHNALLPPDREQRYTCSILDPSTAQYGQGERYRLFQPGGSIANFNAGLVNSLLAGKAEVSDVVDRAVDIARYLQGVFQGLVDRQEVRTTSGIYLTHP